MEHGRGHRTLPHTADERIEAWGPTLPTCLEEAVTGLVESFADTAARPTSRRLVELELDEPESALTTLLDEVIYALDVDGCLPVGVTSTTRGDVVEFEMQMAPVERLRQLGAVPKAISLNELEVRAPESSQLPWRCRFTVDV